MVQPVGKDVKHVMGVEGYPERLKTLNQWKKAGFRLKTGVEGTLYCFSREKGLGAYYFTDQEVVPDTSEETRIMNSNVSAAGSSTVDSDIWNHPGTKTLMKEKGVKNNGFLVLDIETTGFKMTEDEILQVAIIDSDGTVVFNDYFQPVSKRSWPIATRINGIYPNKVAGYRLFKDALPELQDIIYSSVSILGYNSEKFDFPFLRTNGVSFDDCDLDDVMLHIPGRLKLKNHRLETVSEYFGFDWSNYGREHDALADCYGALFVYNKIQERLGMPLYGRPDCESPYMREQHKYWSEESEREYRRRYSKD